MRGWAPLACIGWVLTRAESGGILEAGRLELGRGGANDERPAEEAGRNVMAECDEAPQVGLEPTTLRLTVECSDQLSYWGMVCYRSTNLVTWKHMSIAAGVTQVRQALVFTTLWLAGGMAGP